MGTRNKWVSTTARALALSVMALPALGQPPEPGEPASPTVDEPAPPAVDEPTPGVEESPPGQECSDTSDVIRFRMGSAKLSGDARDTLDQVADIMRADDDRLVRVQGYADPTGNAEANQKLTDKRARAVETYLERNGIDADRVETFSRGEVADQKPPEPDPNQRVAIVTTCARAEERAEESAQPSSEAPPPPPEPAPVETPAETPAETPPAPPPTAEIAPEPGMAPGAEVSRQAMEGEMRRPLGGAGLGISAGGGVVGFNSERSRDLANTGGSWEVRLTLGTRIPVGLDLAYIGSAQELQAAGLDSDALIVGNGAEANFRLQWPTGMVRPFAFGGIGWMHYTVERSGVGSSGLLVRDDIGVIPVGIGVAAGLPYGVMFELRATQRLAFEDQLFNGASNGASARMDSWNVTARLGAEF